MNIELIMNPSIAPVYINASNAVLPIITITLSDFIAIGLNAVNNALQFVGEIIATIATVIVNVYQVINMIIATSFYQTAEITGYSPYTLKIMSVIGPIIAYLILKHYIDYDVHKDNIEEFNALETNVTLLRVNHRQLVNANKVLEQRIEHLENVIRDATAKQTRRFNNIENKIRKLDNMYYE